MGWRRKIKSPRQKQHATATIATLYQLTLQPFNHCPPGMGVSTVSAARILRGQLEGGSGEETMLAMDTFPYLALSKVTTQSRWPCGTQFTSHPPSSRRTRRRFSCLRRPTRFHQCVQYLWPLFYNPLPPVVMLRRPLLAGTKPRDWHVIPPKASFASHDRPDLLYDVELRDSCYLGTHTDTRYRHPRGGGWSWCVRFAGTVGWGQRERERTIKPVHYRVASVCHFSSSHACLSWRGSPCRTLYLASAQAIKPSFLKRIPSWVFFSLPLFFSCKCHHFTRKMLTLRLKQ